jgi:hypothetical protein
MRYALAQVSLILTYFALVDWSTAFTCSLNINIAFIGPISNSIFEHPTEQSAFGQSERELNSKFSSISESFLFNNASECTVGQPEFER